MVIIYKICENPRHFRSITIRSNWTNEQPIYDSCSLMKNIPHWVSNSIFYCSEHLFTYSTNKNCLRITTLG